MDHRLYCIKLARVGLVLSLLILQGCSAPHGASDRMSSSTALRFAISEDPRSMEPGLSVLMQDSQIALNLHVGLFTYDRYSALKPYLVREWSLSDDHLTYTFVLHDGWKWHNGRGVTAGDFKEGWERYLNPKLGAWGASYLNSIVGAQEMLSGTVATLKGVEAPAPNTMKVTLTHPDPLFLLRLGATPTWVAPPEAVVKGEPKWTDNPQGGGPFRFVQWQPHSRIVLEANQSFAGVTPALARVEFLIVPDATTALNMYRSGELDITPVAVSELRGIRQDSVLGRELQFWPRAQLIFIGLNEWKVPAFKDSRVRQAFDRAIERRVICEQVLFDAWAPATQVVPIAVPGHDDQLAILYDPERARALMAEAGYSNGQGFPTVQIVVSGSTEATAAEAVAAQLKQNLGVKIDVHQVESGDFYSGLREQRFDAFLTGWTADYMSAEQWLYRLLHRKSSTNFVGYSNANYEAIVDKALHAETEDAQTPLWREANRIATNDAALIPLAYGRFAYLVKPNVSGFAANAFGPLGFEGVRKDAPAIK